jgi:cytochrome P450
MTGDPDGWTKAYDIIIGSLFDPWVNVFSKVDFLVQYISAKRRKVIKATAEFNSMIDELAKKRRQEILSGERSDIPDNEKDLLTLMIEADLREGTKTSTLELRVTIYQKKYTSSCSLYLPK